MNVRIYGHAKAGKQAVKLFEELAELFNSTGEVYIRRTLKTEREGEREYPPVYEVIYQPNFWHQIDRRTANTLFELGDRYNCEVRFVVRGSHAVAKFHDGGPHFKGN